MVNTIRYCIVVLGVAVCSLSFAGNGNGFSPDGNHRHGGGNSGDLDLLDWWSIKRYAGEHIFDKYAEDRDDVDGPDPANDPVADYETFLPNESEPRISKIESRLLINYMEDPSNVRTARVMAVYHLLHLPAVNGFRRDSGKRVMRLKHAIYAQYFLLRARHLGADEGWINRAIRYTERRLDALLPTERPLDLSEGHDAHKYFIDAFVFHEENRYEAEDRILRDLIDNPTNLLTNHYASAVNLWNGGESGYDDPGILYSFVKASYFGKRITELSMRAEREWENDPENHTLFRLAPTVGGFSAPPRRWLAKFHQDKEAIELVDAEMAEWLSLYPSFYGFPVGVYAFTEPENVFNGFQGLLAGIDACTNNFDIFCDNHPRVTYNVISFFLYSFDYFIRIGDIGTAASMLNFKYVPEFRYDTWNLGQDAWEHRENNIDYIAALYQNDDPSDDPVNGFLKRHKWGPESSTCQLCHQAQGTTWSQEEIDNVASLDEAERHVQDWPVPRVSWDASVIESQ